MSEKVLQDDMSVWVTKRMKRPSAVALSGHTGAELARAATTKFKQGFTTVILVRYNEKEDNEDMPDNLRKLYKDTRTKEVTGENLDGF